MSTQNTRNFCIIAHVDHGKSTLADRMLEVTGTVDARQMRSQFLDKIELERERGITIKLQAVRMEYVVESGKLKVENDKTLNSPLSILNLIDTPGHIDFSYEVSRALAACEGAILLVDASQGIQAQTLANYTKAREAGLTIIPVVNKIDLPASRPEETALDLMETFGFAEQEILFVSGKSGQGVDELLRGVVEKVPAPAGQVDDPLRALIFDSYYDSYQGVVAMVRVVDGRLGRQPLRLMHSGQVFEPLEVGFVRTELDPFGLISTGEVGYVATGLKDIGQIRVGDTITTGDTPAQTPLPGYREPKPMVFANLFPEDADQLGELRAAIEKYNLTDAAFTYTPISSSVLGNGFRCGFLGLLHLDVVRQRLAEEFGVETQITAPSVEYRVMLTNNQTQVVRAPQDLPPATRIRAVEEPWCRVKIFTHRDYVGNLIKMIETRRVEFVDTRYLGERVEMEYRMPLSEVIRDFFDQVKSVSAGYASLDYEVTDYRPVDLVKLEVHLNRQPHEALSQLVVRDQAAEIGKRLVHKLKEFLPAQQFQVPIQAVVGGNVLARETLPAMRKDVTAKLYGGDRTRKDKLLKKQAAGKKRMQQQGRVNIPFEVYREIVRV